MAYLALLRLLFVTVVCATTSLGSDCDCSDTPTVTPGYPFAYPLPYPHPFPQPVFTSKVGQYKCSCKPKRAGQLKFSGGKLFVCTGTEWKSLQYEQSVLYGSKLSPGSSCEDIQKKTLKQSANGIYWIKLSGSKGAFPVYCDMAAGGWTMVFKAVSGVATNVYNTYNSGTSYSETVMAALDVTKKHLDHYKNRIILNWKQFGASKARVVLYKGRGKMLKELKFSVQGSDKLNRFSLSRLTQSPWSDIKTQPKNFFSILGAHSRNFFINRNYGGCPADAGWMGITANLCNWEKHFNPSSNVRVILYSKLSGFTNWNRYNNVGVADTLVVYLR